MRKKRNREKNDIRMMVLDDDSILAASFENYFSRRGYAVTAETDPYKAIEVLRSEKHDILLLDYLMRPVCGDEVIESIREFDEEIFIILVTGHKDMVPPIDTIHDFDIQGYYEKSGRIDQLEIQIEACVKEIRQRKIIREYQRGMEIILDDMTQLYGETNAERTAEKMVEGAVNLLGGKRGYVRYRACDKGEIFKAYGSYSDENEGNWIESSFSDPVESIEGTVAVDTESGNEKNRKKLLDIYSRQAAAAAANSMLYEKLTNSLDEKEKAHLETIRTLLSAVELKDRYTMGHSRRVSALAERIAAEMGLDREQIERTSLAGMFHDIGKIGIPDSILLKNDKLDDREYSMIKSHPEKGAQLLSGISRFSDIHEIVKSHHERMDGTGYPEGLKDSEIPVEARIIAVADSYDAMTSERTYGICRTSDEAVEEIMKAAGSQFDMKAAEALKMIMGG